MQNIILKSEKDNLNAAYKKKLIITLSFAIFFSFLISSVLLIPPYTFSRAKLHQAGSKNDLEKTISQTEEQALAFPVVANTKSKTALSFKGLPSASSRIMEVTDSRPAGVEVNSISYKESSTPGESTLSISGISSSRQSLLSFKSKIESLDFVRTATIPVSNLVKDSNIPFTVNIAIYNKK